MATDENLEKLIKLAESGDPAAMQNLALAYELGVTGKVDYEESKKWWAKAAKRGNGFAMACLSDISEKGLAGEVDLDEAARWKEQALRHGVIDFADRVSKINEEKGAKSLEQLIGKKVLIVDVSATVRIAVSARLKKVGFIVVEAVDGLDGLHKVKSDPNIALIITDLNMPNLNGLDMVKKIRQNADLHSIPIVVLSSESGAEIMKSAKALGLQGWIIKPPKAGSIEETVERFLKKAA